MGVLLIFTLLSGCASEESKAFRDDENVRAEIYETITQKGRNDFNLELKPNMKKLKFALSHGLPVIDDEELTVPVRTVNKPEFQFDASIKIDADNSGYRGLGEIDIESGALNKLGEFLLTNIYKTKYQNDFKEFVNAHEGLVFYSVMVMAKTSVYIEDENEKEKLYKSLSADYNAGKFADPAEYGRLLDKFMLETDKSLNIPYLPELHFDVELNEREMKDSILAEEKFYEIISYAEENKAQLPQGEYTFYMRMEDENNTLLLEKVSISRKK